MKTRLISAAVGIVIALGVFALTILVEPNILCFAIIIVTMIAIYEALNVIGMIKRFAVSIPCFAYGAAIMLSFLIPDSETAHIVKLIATLLFSCALSLSVLSDFEKNNVQQVSVAVIMTIIIVFPLYYALQITLIDGGNGNRLVGLAVFLFCLFISWLTDSCAFFTGTLIGKHKLAPRVSPKKTIEGAVGGLFFGTVLTWAVAYLCVNVFALVGDWNVNIVNILIIGAICSVVSMIGDLSFSVVKRSYQVKDYGNIMPGHGGILDRFDSVIFVCPVVYMMNQYLPILTQVK